MNPIEKPEKIEKQVDNKRINLEFSNNRIQELQQMIQILLAKANWNHNIKITNKEEQKEVFSEALEKGNDWNPDFKFKEIDKDLEALSNNINQCIEASEDISQRNIDNLGFEILTSRDLQNFFKKSFRELKLYTDLANNIRDRKSWKEISNEIWPMISEEKYRKSVNKVQNLENSENKKILDADQLKHMFEKEIQRLDFDYEVEIRDVSGCFNSPSEEKVIVANGNEGKRLYSKKEAEMLTKHEIFHVVRGINGKNISDKFNVLGFHSPFYDKTEEGGALYREIKTGANYESKDFDYHLRLIAAYKLYNGERFHKVIEDLMDLGGTLDRSFYLVARNREALRHHIYLSGMEDWKKKDVEKLLLGKVNFEWSEKFWKEIQQGSFRRPKIGEKRLFE